MFGWGTNAGGGVAVKRVIGALRTSCSGLPLAALIAASSLAGHSSAAWAVNITMHHYDSLRTGWNQSETILSPATVSGSTFGILATAQFDAQVDAQPLIVQGLTIAGQGTHDVVFIETENNSVYALDAYSGALLLQTNLGPPVPPSRKPRHDQEGIQSTPVIDTTAGTMYVMAYTLEKNQAVYRLHALSLTTLTDVAPSSKVTATSELDDGSQVKFVPHIERQRPALVEANGNIYAAFGAYGDADSAARGWILGWNASTLQPLPQGVLTNHQANAGLCNNAHKKPCFLSSIWMSGAGIAADNSGNVYLVTGNSDTGTFDGADNIQETALKLSADLSQILDEFTPWNVEALDDRDGDFGAGGIMLLPDQNLSFPHLAVAGGKSGALYLLNRDDLGGHVLQPPDNVLGIYNAGGCWCAESYYTGSDGIGRVVTSGDANVKQWRVVAANNSVALSLENKSAKLQTGQDHGFFTSVSSNGTAADSALIWAVGRPQTKAGTLTLYAFDAHTAATLVSVGAGTWPNINYNANVVPVVANGTVYVAGGSQLAILGLGGQIRWPVSLKGPDPALPRPLAGHEIYGTIESVDGARILLRLRNTTSVTIDASQAIDEQNTVPLVVGNAVGVDGVYDKAGVFDASAIFRAKESPALWLNDR
ncbi:MAG: hypothetical protein ABSD74_04630 [Rhizomicrobium sp.]|jgi:hypothetical protein